MSEILSKIYIGTHVKYPLFLSDFNEILIFSTEFRKKYSDVKFHENSSSGSRICSIWTDRQDLTVAFPNFTHVPEKEIWVYTRRYYDRKMVLLMSRDSSVGIATRYGPDGSGIESLWGRHIPQPSRLVLGPTQPPIQRVPGFSRG